LKSGQADGFEAPGKRTRRFGISLRHARTIAFSSEVDTGSREENVSNQDHRASLLIPSEAKRLGPSCYSKKDGLPGHRQRSDASFERLCPYDEIKALLSKPIDKAGRGAKRLFTQTSARADSLTAGHLHPSDSGLKTSMPGIKAGHDNSIKSYRAL
jgi:hypothetical protein